MLMTGKSRSRLFQVKHLFIDLLCVGEWKCLCFSQKDIEWLGSGAQGAVFSGKLYNEIVAVKKVKDVRETDIRHLRKLNHENIVKFKWVFVFVVSLLVANVRSFQGCLHSVSSIRHRHGILPLRSAKSNHPRRPEGHYHIESHLMDETDRNWHAIPPPSQNHSQGFEISKVRRRKRLKVAPEFLSNSGLAFSILIGHGEIIKISDFGTSREFNDISTKMSFAGTVAWMAPEVIRNEPCSEKVWGFFIAMEFWSWIAAKMRSSEFIFRQYPENTLFINAS